jgi:hypothetical protein
MATTIAPIAGISAGEASNIALQVFSSSEVLTACKNGSGNLELIGWKAGDTTLTRAADSGRQAGAVSEVALALSDRHAVTAVRNGSNHLLLISWDVPAQLASITRHGDSGSLAGEASQIALVALGKSMFVSACRSGSGNLLLICWQLQADGSFKRLGDSGNQAGAVSAVAMTALRTPTNTVVTAVRNGSGILELIAWDVSSNGATIKRRADSAREAGAVSEISIAAARSDGSAQPGFITAVRNASGILEVIDWRLTDTEMVIERRGDSGTQAGEASHVAIGLAGTPPTYLTSMRRGSGDLELIAFQIPANGSVTRSGDFGGRQGTDVTETKITSLGGGRAVSAVRRANFLNVNTWSVT